MFSSTQLPHFDSEFPSVECVWLANWKLYLLTAHGKTPILGSGLLQIWPSVFLLENWLSFLSFQSSFLRRYLSHGGLLSFSKTRAFLALSISHTREVRRSLKFFGIFLRVYTLYSLQCPYPTRTEYEPTPKLQPGYPQYPFPTSLSRESQMISLSRATRVTFPAGRRIQRLIVGKTVWEYKRRAGQDKWSPDEDDTMARCWHGTLTFETCASSTSFTNQWSRPLSSSFSFWAELCEPIRPQARRPRNSYH